MELQIKHKNEEINELIREYFQEFHKFDDGNFFYKGEAKTVEDKINILKKFKNLGFKYSWRDSTCYQLVVCNKDYLCFLDNFEDTFVVKFYNNKRDYKKALATNTTISAGIKMFEKIKLMNWYKYIL